MRRSRWIAPVAALLMPFLAGSASSASPASHATTVRIFTTPVTASGHAASGFTVKAERDDEVDCSPASPSPVAISPNVEECSPSAAYAVACWKSATPHRVLCMLDPRSHKLTSAKLIGKFAKTPAVSAKQLAPFVIVLTDGTVCSIRDGGAWGQLKQHPNYYGAYSCNRHGVVWLRYTSHTTVVHNGVDESASSWTVQTATGDSGPLITRHIARAYFVATATS
jgi:hypothetical protein